MLERKGIPYSRIDLVAVLSKPILRAAGFPGVTVPAVRLDGRRIQGSRAIARELDRLVPEPPLFPADPEARRRSRRRRRWGDEVLQGAARRLVWNLLSKDSGADRELPAGRPPGAARLARGEDGPADRQALGPLQRGRRRARDRADLAALPGDARPDRRLHRRRHPRRGSEPNAADLQIAPSVAPADDDRRHPARDRGAAGRRFGAAARPRISGRDAAGLPGRLAGAAQRAAAESARTARPARGPRALEAVARAGSRPAAAAPGSSSSSGTSTNRREVTSRCGSVSRSRLELEVAEQQQVDVDRARAVARAAAKSRPASASTALQSVEERFRLEVGRDPDRGVEEVRLVEDLADRLGLVAAGDRLDRDAPLAEAGDGRPEVRDAVADVRAEPEVAGPSGRSLVDGGGRRGGPTATSPIASGIGGSVLAAGSRSRRDRAGLDPIGDQPAQVLEGPAARPGDDLGRQPATTP